MNDSLQLIDGYFNKTLSESEIKTFEERCVTDSVFAQEVAFYISVRDQLKQELYEQKTKDFKELYTELSSKQTSNPGTYRKLIRIASIAAACLVIFLGWQLLFNTPSPQQLAQQYITEDLKNLSLQMSGPEDSLQSGIDAYNHKQYDKAEAIFYQLSLHPDADYETIKNLGIVYLAQGDYDKALVQFDRLSKISLVDNPGPFFKALTLMKRSATGDREKAKELLEEVIRNGYTGNKEAEIWIKKL